MAKPKVIYIGIENIRGSQHSDEFIGDNEANEINSLSGNDTIEGNGGNDSIYAGAGDDIVRGGDGYDIADGGDGADLLYGGHGSDTLQGKGGDDILLGDAGTDVLEGGDGNDILIGGQGVDSLYGGNGSDAFTFSADMGLDVVYDFENGVDLIDVHALAGGNFTVQAYGDNDTEITTGNGERLVLRNVDVDDITADDFVGLTTTLNRGANGEGGTGTTNEGANHITLASTQRKSGTEDSDIFVVDAGTHTATWAQNFDQGVDLIDLSAWGVKSLSDINVTQSQTNPYTLITHTSDDGVNSKLRVFGDDGNAPALTADDFIFIPNSTDGTGAQPVNPPASDTLLVVDGGPSGQFGNKYNGLSDADGKVTFAFESTDEDLTLNLNTYDIDFVDEVDVLLNGESIGYLQTTANNRGGSSSFSIDADALQDGYNILEFQNKDVTWMWGIQDAQLSANDTILS